MAGPLKVIRYKCLDCSVGSYAEVERCLVRDCPLWSYRFGIRPQTAARQGKDVTQEFANGKALPQLHSLASR